MEVGEGGCEGCSGVGGVDADVDAADTGDINGSV